MESGGGKKRYAVWLTESRANRVKALIKEVGMPAGAWSALLDEALIGYESMLLKMRKARAEGKQLSFADLFTHMASEVLRDSTPKD